MHKKNWAKMAIFWIFGSKSAINQAKIDGFLIFLALNISKLYGQDGQTDKFPNLIFLIPQNLDTSQIPGQVNLLALVKNFLE